ncbi:MAG TPA: nucleotidyltransferase domain-containing protein [Oligoflexia bacterium]|nr:nucleotidyltransferase domain-containing protein [Oligoflexia bacterium]HMP48626.1 nucleotidyltransferase domain-containing protein [Oligoflexia bacterium]
MSNSFLLRLPQDRLDILKNIAGTMNCSLNKVINRALEQFLTSRNLQGSQSEIISSILGASFGPEVRAIILFGSVAKNTASAKSDYDLLIVLSEETEIKRSLYTHWDNEVAPLLTPEMTQGMDASPHFVNLKSDLDEVHGLWLEVAISGKILWEKDTKTESLLHILRLAISQNRFTRKLSHGQPYWIRN